MAEIAAPRRPDVSRRRTTFHPLEPVGLTSAGDRIRATLAASRWLEHRQLRAESGHPLDCNRATRSGPLGAFAAHGLHKLGTRISVA